MAAHTVQACLRRHVLYQSVIGFDVDGLAEEVLDLITRVFERYGIQLLATELSFQRSSDRTFQLRCDVAFIKLREGSHEMIFVFEILRDISGGFIAAPVGRDSDAEDELHDIPQTVPAFCAMLKYMRP